MHLHDIPKRFQLLEFIDKKSSISICRYIDRRTIPDTLHWPKYNFLGVYVVVPESEDTSERAVYRRRYQLNVLWNALLSNVCITNITQALVFFFVACLLFYV